MTTDTASRPAASDPARFMELGGLQRVEAIAAGREPMAPMLQGLEVTLHAWSEGRIELRAVPQARFYNFMNAAHGGWALTLLDTCMALSALSTLLPGEFAPTLDTSGKFVRPITEQAGELRAMGQVVSRGRRVIAMDGRIEDAAGRLYAHGTSTCLISDWRG